MTECTTDETLKGAAFSLVVLPLPGSSSTAQQAFGYACFTVCHEMLDDGWGRGGAGWRWACDHAVGIFEIFGHPKIL